MVERLLTQGRKNDARDQVHVQVTSIIADLQWRSEEISSIEAEAWDYCITQTVKND